MENQSKVSKFVSRQTAKMMKQSKKVCIFLAIGAVLGVLSMVLALFAVDKRVNPQSGAVSGRPAAVAGGDMIFGDFACRLENGKVTVVAYNGDDNEVEVPALINGWAVTAIGDSAFAGNKTIASITLPDSVVSIGISSFSGCSRLIHVEMSEGLKTIGDKAFANCKMLRAVTLPQSFEGAPASAFKNCSDDFSLVVYEGSAAQSYAEKEGFDYSIAQPEAEEEVSESDVL